MRDLMHISSFRCRSIAVFAGLCATALILISASCGAQVFDMRWIGGYPDPSGDPHYGGNKTIFSPPQETTTILEPRDMRLSTGIAVMTDENDSIFAYTNGYTLANMANQPMLNGTGLNPTTYVGTTYGSYSANAQIFLPWPSEQDSFALIHMSPDTVNAGTILHSARLYFSVIAKYLDNGMAGVVSKNNVIIEEPLLVGGLSAVRHANGRDWWIFTHGIDSDEFISFILTPYGFEGPFFQAIGTTQVGGVPRASFSPSGDKLAYTGYDTGLDVFDFDRCTGILSNWQHADITDGSFTRSVQFSPDGSLVYVSSVNWVYQYPLPSGILGDPETVATYDGFYDEYPILQTFFANMGLAPDGRIYISTGNGTRYMHVIHEPDNAGVACGLIQHDHFRQTYTFNSIPYRPNYLLGPVDGTVCDSLGITANVSEARLQDRVRVQPNPSNGVFGINYPAHAQPGLLEVLDATGRFVYQHRLSAWSTVHQVDLTGQPAGMYHCRLSWGTRSTSVRVILQP